MTEHVVLEVLLGREIEKLSPTDQRLCVALLQAIRHVQAPEMFGHLPDKLMNTIEAWYSDHELGMARRPDVVAQMVDQFAALSPDDVANFCAKLGLVPPQTGRLTKKLTTERRSNSDEATAFSVVAKLIGRHESSVKDLARKGRKK